MLGFAVFVYDMLMFGSVIFVCDVFVYDMLGCECARLRVNCGVGVVNVFGFEKGEGSYVENALVWRYWTSDGKGGATDDDESVDGGIGDDDDNNGMGKGIGGSFSVCVGV